MYQTFYQQVINELGGDQTAVRLAQENKNLIGFMYDEGDSAQETASTIRTRETTKAQRTPAPIL